MKLSHEKTRNLLYEAIQPKNSGAEPYSCWIEEVFDTEFIYQDAGKFYKAPYEVTSDDEVKIGAATEVKKDIEYRPVFAVERMFACFKETTGRGTVIRRGKLFEAGDFPDKNVEFDDDDLARAVEQFSPVPNDLEHGATILDDKLGSLSRVWKKGSELFGDVEIPDWLDKVIGDEPIKVSLAFDKAKRIVGNALVLRPRIADAAIMSAFSESSTTQPKPDGTAPKDQKPMKTTLKEAIKHLFGIEKVDDLDAEVTLPDQVTAPPTAPAVTTPAPEATPAPTFKADPRVAVLESQLLAERAFAFADGIIKERKAVPAQREQIATMFSQAVRADATDGTIFSETGLVEGTQVASIRAYFAAAPAHSLVGEAIPNDSAILLFGAAKKDGMDDDKKKKYLGMSALGRKATENDK
jgi:hypothetical protein